MDSTIEAKNVVENNIAECWIKIGDECRKIKKRSNIGVVYYKNAIECCEKYKDTNETNNFKYWGLALLHLAKMKKDKYFRAKFKNFEDASTKINDSETLLIKGALYFDLKRNKEAKEWFKKSEMSILRILTFLEEKDEEKIIYETDILHSLLNSNETKDGKFFNAIIKNLPQENRNKINKYKKIYIHSIFIISRLHVNDPNEKLVAHYREKDISQQLLFKDIKFRLNATDYSNDPTEGKTLLDFLYGKNSYKTDEELNTEYEAFTGSFVFDCDNLNMFRLYGKEDNKKEGTGVSLVFKDTFFNKNADMAVETPKEEKSSLYRCIYIDPHPITDQNIVTVGQKEKYLFYREKKKNAFHRYIERMDDIIERVDTEMSILKEEANKLDKDIVGQLLLNLRYLVKHIAFKEEQECRIVKILDLHDKVIEIKDDYFKQMYYEYQPKVSEHIAKIYFGPKAEGFELFKSILKNKGLEKIECKKSENPLA